MRDRIQLDVVISCGPRLHRVLLIHAFLFACAAAPALSRSQAPSAPTGVTLDRVVAVVNNQAILSSDVDEEIRLAILNPDSGGGLTPPHALDELISRALIQQQIHEEDAQASAPTQAQVDTRLAEMRKELPACVRENCTTEEGWQAFLAAHRLTAPSVDDYVRNRIEILAFIEQRFRQGIRVEPDEVEAYYRKVLLPQYAPGSDLPALEKVAPRIEEILLQQRVNALFDDWLRNLRDQGEIEVLDPSLETAHPQIAGGAR